MHLIFSFGLWAMWEQDFGFGDLIVSIKNSVWNVQHLIDAQ